MTASTSMESIGSSEIDADEDDCYQQGNWIRAETIIGQTAIKAYLFRKREYGSVDASVIEPRKITLKNACGRK